MEKWFQENDKKYPASGQDAGERNEQNLKMYPQMEPQEQLVLASRFDLRNMLR